MFWKSLDDLTPDEGTIVVLIGNEIYEASVFLLGDYEGHVTWRINGPLRRVPFANSDPRVHGYAQVSWKATETAPSGREVLVKDIYDRVYLALYNQWRGCWVRQIPEMPSSHIQVKVKFWSEVC